MAGEKGHRRRELARVEGLEEVGHEPSLVEATRRGLEPPAEAGEIGEERHAPILVPERVAMTVTGHRTEFATAAGIRGVQGSHTRRQSGRLG